jgi:hypothetical protein
VKTSGQHLDYLEQSPATSSVGVRAFGVSREKLMVNRTRFAFFALVLAILPSRAYSQAGQSTQPSLTPREILVINDTGIAVRFQLSCDDEDDESTWEVFSLAAAHNATYNCGSDPRVWIRISTEQRRVQYKLETNRRYRIAWNAEKKLWDIFSIAT